MAVIVQNQQEKVPVPESLTSLAERAAAVVLAVLGPKQETELGITFVDDAAIKMLNYRYRGKDEPTDVLSFAMNETVQEGEREVLLLGDVVISLETAARWAIEEGRDLHQEVAQLVVHGALHLLGYDHETAAEAARMKAQEEEILRLLG
ncbi:rRNA maturation RNase YbeY [Thermodesulfitimonas autotrophica]|uniref:rRNA maturation RNase YbeY n=1 Tax=Thermodesulfitimonas autotrophica TaxID=1894989 RepID=UPI000F4DBF49|nr:rRNA maturation RNase YbeY [Thermodesulfitimonas autotrophica]